jgi:protein involved in sex pheromone biosynthesis
MLVGCNNKENFSTIDIEFDSNYYQVYSPYKKGVSNNYVVNNVLNNYDILDIESSLMNLSTVYFKTNNSYYQEGQYLKESELKTLLSNKELNNAPNIVIDDVDIEPTYITSIYEQNFLASNGHLKGVSLAIVLNPYQAYKNSYGNYVYKIVDDNTLIDFGKKTANKLIEYMYNKEELKDIKIIVGLYFQKSPNSMLPGGFKYIGITNKNIIEMEEVDYSYQYLNSDYVNKNDINTATGYKNIEKSVKNVFSNVYMSGKGFYQNNTLKNIEIDVNNSSFSKSQLLYLSQLLSDEIGKSFDNKVDIRIFIKSNNQILALIRKDKNTLRSNVYIMRG